MPGRRLCGGEISEKLSFALLHYMDKGIIFDLGTDQVGAGKNLPEASIGALGRDRR